MESMDLNLIDNRHIFLAYQTRFSVIITSADKSYLTYPYSTRGINNQRTIGPVSLT